MDLLHPSVVHFPIGILSLYTLLETMSLVGALRKNLMNVKFILLGFGTVSAVVARIAGEHDAEFFTQETRTLELHEALSLYVVFIFTFLFLSYIVQFLMNRKTLRTNILLLLVIHPVIRTCISGIGFLLLTVVGALGGALVHGPNADPMIRFITDILELQ